MVVDIFIGIFRLNEALSKNFFYKYHYLRKYLVLETFDSLYSSEFSTQLLLIYMFMHVNADICLPLTNSLRATS